MLGLPIVTGLAGFLPALVMFVVAYLFMTTTGLLLLEVNVWMGKDANILSMAERTLGRPAKWLCAILYLFLFYSLMIAYLAGGGALLSTTLGCLLGIKLSHTLAVIISVIIYGILDYAGTRSVDRFNRVMMVGLVIAYAALVIAGAQSVQGELLTFFNPKYALFVMPVIVIAFGFHNIVPTLQTYLRGSLKKLRLTIIVGNAIPLLVYLIWEWLILGLVPVEGEQGLVAALQGGMEATQALRACSDAGFVNTAAEYFALFAIITSFLGVSLSFVDFLSDGLNIAKTAYGKVKLCLLALVPPFVMALVYPTIFLKALSFAGGICAVILFGVVPALMVWVGRSKMGMRPTVIGGRVLLVVLILIALGVFGVELAQEVGLLAPPEVR